MPTLLQARSEDAPGLLDVGDAPLPTLAGEVQDNFDLRFDAGAIYRSVHEIWRPMLMLALTAASAGADSGAEPLLEADDMPDTNEVAALLEFAPGGDRFEAMGASTVVVAGTPGYLCQVRLQF